MDFVSIENNITYMKVLVQLRFSELLDWAFNVIAQIVSYKTAIKN